MITEYIKNLLPLEIQSKTYIGELPTDINECAAIQEFGGTHDHYFAKEQIDTPLIKVIVRDPIFTHGYDMIQTCKRSLTSYADAQVLGIILLRDIEYLGRDEKRRNLWQIIFKIYSYIGG